MSHEMQHYDHGRAEVAPTSPALPEVYTPPTQIADAGAAMIAQRAAAEIHARTLVAMNRPRSFAAYRRKILEACERPLFADDAIYSVPRGGKSIEGLSIRFAEECARAMGNLDITTQVVSEDLERRVIECAVVDLETNTPWRQTVVVGKTVERKSVQPGTEVVGSRLNSSREMVYIVRATEDEIFVNQQRTVSKMLRNLILKHVPSDLQEEAREMAEATIAAKKRKEDAVPIGERRKKMIDAFFKLGVSEAQIAEYAGKPIADTNDADLHVLGRVYSAVKGGEFTWAEVMAERAAGTASVAGSAASGSGRSASERLGALAAKEAPTPAPVREGPPPAVEATEAAPVATTAPTTAAPEPQDDDVEGLAREFIALTARKANGETLTKQEAGQLAALRRREDVLARAIAIEDEDARGKVSA